MKEQGQCNASGAKSIAPKWHKSQSGIKTSDAAVCPIPDFTSFSAFSIDIVFIYHPDGFWFADTADAFKGDPTITKKKLTVTAENLIQQLADNNIEVKDGVDALYQQICSHLKMSAQDNIALARKAGYAVCGLQKIREKIINKSSDMLGMLFVAHDAQASDLQKLKTENIVIIDDLFDQKELGCIFGRDSAVYAYLYNKKFAESLSDKIQGVKDFSKALEIRKNMICNNP